MPRFARTFAKAIPAFIVLTLLVLAMPLMLAQAPDDNGPPQVGEGSLLFRSPVSGRFESVPLLHTDAVLDVRGLVVAATVTQQYANSSTAPIEAVYVFP